HNSTVYDEMLRVPLLVRPPRGLRGPQRIAEPVGLVDLAPSISTWASVPLPAELAGRPLPVATVFHAGDRARPLTARSASSPERFAIVDRDWKYVRALADDGSSDELYDLATDPGEHANRVSQDTDRLLALRAAAQREIDLQRAHAA